MLTAKRSADRFNARLNTIIVILGLTWNPQKNRRSCKLTRWTTPDQVRGDEADKTKDVATSLIGVGGKVRVEIIGHDRFPIILWYLLLGSSDYFFKALTFNQLAIAEHRLKQVLTLRH